ncbi:helix-turn-helix domain-containing protein [Mycolicibacterium conceptionense]|uniref:PucR family transcriptional regulator n=1 Tax=Mycolicibacterium conceptionense TaxID=451644 RepID=UPI0032046EFE
MSSDAGTINLLGASVESNVDTVFHALLHGIAVDRITAPAAAVEYARRLAQHGVPVNALVRAYRLGQQRLTELILAEIEAIDIEPAARVATIGTIMKVTFDYIDSVSQRVVAVYEEERERWLENQHSIRALKVRDILAGGATVDIEGASADIRYPLRWHHLALVVWYPNADDRRDELARLQRFVRDLGQAIGADANPLFAPVDRATAWAWLPYRVRPTDPEIQIRSFLSRARHPPNVAVGSTDNGVDGFRRSHQVSIAAWELGRIRGADTSFVIAAEDPEVMLAAILAGNLPRLRDWVAWVLGPLAADTDNDARLRQSLRVFLRSGSYKIASEELNLHVNSVRYRIDRAIERRGRSIADDRLDVEMALMVCHWYGTAVLQPA